MKNVNYRICSVGTWLFIFKYCNLFFMSENSDNKILRKKRKKMFEVNGEL